jgi:hypothetical protein
MTFVDILYRLYRSQPASFPSSYTTEVAIERLSHLAQRPAWLWCQEGLMGKVTPSKVALWRHDQVNSFKPIFTGVFTLRNGVTVLSGYFSTPWFTRVFLPVWYSGLAAIAFLIIGVGIAQNEPLMFLMLLGPCAIGVGGIAVVYIGWKESSNDVAYISEAIRRGIGGENPG